MEDRIEPSTYDVIVLGTGLPESVVAASIAACGKSVLHLDCTGFYGSHWTSLSFSQISSFAASGGHLPLPDNFSHAIRNPNPGSEGSDWNSGLQERGIDDLDGCVADPGIALRGGSLGNGLVADEAVERLAENDLEVLELREQPSFYSDVRVWFAEGASLGPRNRFYLDLAGPKLAFCAGPLIDSLLKLQAEHHVKFTAVESSYIWRDNAMAAVPASRADVFQDRSLSLPDKRFLMRFFKMVTDYTESPDGTVADLAAGDIEQPFVVILQRQNLPSHLQEIILYAIALADEDQELVPDTRRLLTAKEGFASLALYLASVSRFPTAPGPFLYPMYGQGDLTQAFCRCAAVRGALQVLQMQVRGFLVDKETKQYRGIDTVSGQHLYSGKLITGPSFCVGSVPPTSTEDRGSEEETARCSSSVYASTSTESSNRNMPPYKVARCICITDQSLQPGASTLLVIFPPRSLSVTQTLVVRALQLGSRSEICPDGKFVVQLSTICSNSTAGDEALQAAASALFQCENMESDEGTRDKGACGMPDETLDYRAVMALSEMIFHKLFPEQEFLPRAVVAANNVKDGEEDDFDGVNGA